MQAGRRKHGLAVAAVGYFVLSPYPAMRRVIGTYLVLVLFVGRLATHRQASKRALRLIAASGAALGLLFAITDVLDARTRTAAAERAFADLDELAGRYGDGTRWYVGHWGFQYYAERAGVVPAIPMRSRLAPGDWIAVAEGVTQPHISFPPRPRTRCTRSSPGTRGPGRRCRRSTAAIARGRTRCSASSCCA